VRDYMHVTRCALLNPKYKGRQYIGFTVNPRRRIRQHDGELGNGTWRTHSKRPWEMILSVHGFCTQVLTSAIRVGLAAPNKAFGCLCLIPPLDRSTSQKMVLSSMHQTNLESYLFTGILKSIFEFSLI
jgi:predicted GIY-YIG superfamily endonuclease